MTVMAETLYVCATATCAASHMAKAQV